jgi:hypothetical protein
MKNSMVEVADLKGVATVTESLLEEEADLKIDLPFPLVEELQNMVGSQSLALL